MTVLQIIEDFKNGKLKDGDTFDYITDNTEYNPHIVRLKVGCNGHSLTESWISFYGNIVRNNWTIYKNNIQDNINFIKH